MKIFKINKKRMKTTIKTEKKISTKRRIEVLKIIKFIFDFGSFVSEVVLIIFLSYILLDLAEKGHIFQTWTTTYNKMIDNGYFSKGE